jgi:hypothetical protein
MSFINIFLKTDYNYFNSYLSFFNANINIKESFKIFITNFIIIAKKYFNPYSKFNFKFKFKFKFIVAVLLKHFITASDFPLLFISLSKTILLF